MKVLKGKEQITLKFGNQKLNGANYNHKGLDLVKYKNQLDNIIAIDSGTVISVKTGIKGFVNGSYGNYVYIQHQNGYRSFYAHLSRVDVKKGQRVKKGQVIGYMGATGMAFGAHLHLEIEKNGKLINPEPFIFGKSNFNSTKKTIDQIAKEVIAQKWGNGIARRVRLTAAGYNYNEVQNKVNQLLGNKSTKKSVDTIAREVIAGKWGNGKDRKNRLQKAGYNYNEVQKRVNQLM